MLYEISRDFQNAYIKRSYQILERSTVTTVARTTHEKTTERLITSSSMTGCRLPFSPGPGLYLVYCTSDQPGRGLGRLVCRSKQFRHKLCTVKQIYNSHCAPPPTFVRCVCVCVCNFYTFQFSKTKRLVIKIKKQNPLLMDCVNDTEECCCPAPSPRSPWSSSAEWFGKKKKQGFGGGPLAIIRVYFWKYYNRGPVVSPEREFVFFFRNIMCVLYQ